MKTGGINIRPMRAADAAAVAGMTRALADFHRDGTSVGEAHLLAHCLGPNAMGSVLVATAGKRLVGFALCYDWLNVARGVKTRHIDLMFVRAEYRRRGLGGAMLKALAARAIAEGCVHVTVGALTSNEIANKFYRGLGFEARTDSAGNFRLTEAGLAALATRGD